MIPKERARPLDQGDFGTCTLHAVANASVEKCMDFGLDFNLDEMVGGFKQLNFIDIVEGNDVHEFDQAVIKRMADKRTKKLYDVTLHIISHIHSKSEDPDPNYPAKKLNFPQICPKMPQNGQK